MKYVLIAQLQNSQFFFSMVTIFIAKRRYSLDFDRILIFRIKKSLRSGGVIICGEIHIFVLTFAVNLLCLFVRNPLTGIRAEHCQAV